MSSTPLGAATAPVADAADKGLQRDALGLGRIVALGLAAVAACLQPRGDARLRRRRGGGADPGRVPARLRADPVHRSSRSAT
jgi:hypothetical protein